MDRLATRVSRQRPFALSRLRQAASFSQILSTRQKVQTPVQSQNKGDVAPELRPAEGTPVQTPIQSQKPGPIFPNPASSNVRPKRDLKPFYTLFGGLALGSVFVYYYYEYRKEHMQKKWENMIREAQEARKGKS